MPDAADAPPAAAGALLFASAKRTLARKIDYSPKGSLDAPVAGLVARVNAQPELATTSSCSGRIAIYEHGGAGCAAAPEGDAGGGEVGGEVGSNAAAITATKGGGRWLFVSHDQPLTPADVARALHADARAGASAVLKVEPLILHVQCRSVAAAQRLMRVAVGAGFRESGMGIGAGGKIVVAVRTTAASLEVPLRVAGRTIADAAYVRELVAVANERFREIGERRARFTAAFDAEYPPSAPAPPHASAVPSSGGAVRCSGCGAEFASRNALFTRHLVVAPVTLATSAGEGASDVAAARSPARRVCPYPRCPPAASPSAGPLASLAAAAASPAAAAAATAAGAPSTGSSGGGVQCTGCGGGFASRNQLHRHIDHCPPARARKLANSSSALAAAPGSAAAPTDAVAAARVSPAGAPLLVPSVPLGPQDLSAAQLATARMATVLSSVARQRADAVAASLAPDGEGGGGGPSIDWEQLPAAASAGDAAALLARWGHTACVIQSCAPGRLGGGEASATALVAIVGGYRCTGVHGRSADVALYDPATRRVHAPEVVVVAAAGAEGSVGAHGAASHEAPDAALPQPMTRHTATVVPAAALASLGAADRQRAGEYEPVLVLGGNNGPLKPHAEPWWLLVRRRAPPAGGAAVEREYELQWVRAHVDCAAAAPAAPASPPPRWGHTASFVPACAAVGSPPAVVLCGGRDAHTSFNDVWCAELRSRTGSGGAPSAPHSLPSIRWHSLGPDVEAARSVWWRGRFYHAAAVLDAPLQAVAAATATAAAAGAAAAAAGTATAAAPPTLVASIAVHGGFPRPFLVDTERDSATRTPPQESVAEAMSGGDTTTAATSSSSVLLADLHLLQLAWQPPAPPGGLPAAAGSFVASWAPVPPAATRMPRGASGGPPLEPRCSHSLLSLGHGQLLLLGGECASPQNNAAQVLTLQLSHPRAHGVDEEGGDDAGPVAVCESSLAYTVATAASPRADALGYAALDAEALASQAGSASAGRTATVALSVARDRVLPMLLRAVAVVLPAVSPSEPLSGAAPFPLRTRAAQTTGERSRRFALFSCGGGAVCFAFGSHTSPSYLAELHVPPRRLPAAPLPRSPVLESAAGDDDRAGADGESPPTAAATAAVVVLARHAQRVRVALEAAGLLDRAFQAAPMAPADAACALRGGAAPAGGDSAPLLACGAKLVGVPHLADVDDTPALQVPVVAELVALGEAACAHVRLPRYQRVDPGTGGESSLRRLQLALRELLAARGVRGPLAEALLRPGAPGGVPRRVERLGADLLLIPRDALTHPAWLLPPCAASPPPSTHEGQPQPQPQPQPPEQPQQQATTAASSATITAPVWDVVCATLRASRLARREEIDDGPTRASRVVMLRTRTVPGAYELPRPALSPQPLQQQPQEEGGEPAAGADGLQPPQRGPSSPAAPATAAILSERVPALRAGGNGTPAGALAVVNVAAAVAAPPSSGPQPEVVDPTSGGWVCVAENALLYAFDATATMFSSGNVSEKARVGRLPANGETVVDLYAGIGYWTLPLVLHAGAAHVHACDWNPHAVRTLRINLAANRVPPGRVTVWPGDNAQLLRSAVMGTADRVVAGLIPSSERGWRVAVAALKPAGGWLHVHMNKADHELAAWVPALCAAVQALAGALGRAWRVEAAHVERVKSYAPHVWHVVVDLRCAAVAGDGGGGGGA